MLSGANAMSNDPLYEIIRNTLIEELGISDDEASNFARNIISRIKAKAMDKGVIFQPCKPKQK